ncbi:MAG TPA: universal stress protein [Actinomycetota bacterium]|jgi:nucleotide-binding universal stress UspA family protein/nitrite reductase/ring-hydroxylating ferredoxin subunit
MAYKRIVLATDGSPTAETAERVAASLAAATKGKLTVVHAYTDPARADDAVARALAIAERAGAKTQVALSADEPADAIVRIADENDAEVIVTGSRGLFRGEQLIGSVVRKVVTHAPCDVLLVRTRQEAEPSPEGAPYRRILLATDGSATADRAARKAYALARRLEASMTLVFVGHPRTGELVLGDTAATIGEDEPVGLLILDGDPAERIVETAAQEGFDLVVIGNRGMTGARAALLGSVPRDVAENATCDVLVARTIAQSLSEIEVGEGGIVETGDHKVAVYRDERGNVTTLSAKCTHMGCTVKWNAAERTWDCPCHGSRFGPTGDVVNGPAERPLSPSDV